MHIHIFIEDMQDLFFRDDIIFLWFGMNEYLLTIAIPTYNREKLLRRLLNSIVTELYDCVEVLVSDNASSDGTEEMIHSEFPQITYYRNSTNIGPDSNFLECYKKAKGEYVWLVGSDDVILEGAIDRIISFLRKNSELKLPLIFLNHNSFSGEYLGAGCCSESFLDMNEEDKVATSKSELVKYSGRQLTFISAFLMRTDDLHSIKNPENYLYTNFIQTYLAFDVCVKSDRFGIIFYPCVTQDLTPGNSSLYMNYAKEFEVFGPCMYNVMVRHAIASGFNSHQMRKVFIKGLTRSYAAWFLWACASESRKEIKKMRKIIWPVLKNYPFSCFLVFPFSVVPPWMARVYVKMKKRG